MRTLLLLALPLLLAADHGEHLYSVAEEPTDLGGATFLPWQVVRADAGTYSPALELPAGTAIDALHRMDNGHWLISVESPVRWLAQLAANIVEFQDEDDLTFVVRFDGALAGLAPGVNVDAVFLDGGDDGDLVMSFDVPTTVGGQTFAPADLVRFDGSSFSVYFDASATSPPVPASINVTGADTWGSLTLLTFDAPVTLGDQTYLPGQVASWDGVRFALFQSSAHADSIALLARPGIVPETLDVAKEQPQQGRFRLRLSWSESCSVGAEDYAIYEGTIGDWYSHTAIDCSDDDGDLTETIGPSPGNRYYLIVPLNGSAEGSYGLDFQGAERPPGASTCVHAQRLGECL
jgi:hypothetical protein